MPKPEEVYHSKFELKNVVYNKDGFSVAYGIWKNSEQCFACRWNGGDDSIGFPNTRGYPVWFMLSNEIAQAIVLGLSIKGQVNIIELLNGGLNAKR